MFFASRKLVIQLFRISISLAVLALSLAWPTPATASCFITGLPDLPGPPPPPSPLRIAVDQEDLLVTVHWPESADASDAKFVLSNSAGVVVGTWHAERFPGEETEQRLTGALASVATAGFQYLLELREPEQILGWRHVRVMVSCDNEPCEYRLVTGLESNSIVVSETFWNALDEARAGGSHDLLETVREQHAEAAGEIPNFVWQWQQAATEPLEGCSCSWLTVEYESSPGYIGPRAGNPPRHRFGRNHNGVAFMAGVQSRQGTATVQRSETEGRSVIGLHLLCTQTRGANPARYPTSWPSLPWLKLSEPLISSCAAPCTPVIEHVAEVRGCAQGGVTSRYGQQAKSWAEIDAQVLLNGQQKIAGAALIDIEANQDELIRDLEYLSKSSTATLKAEAAIADLTTGSFLEAEVTPPNNGPWNSYSFAASSLEYFTSLIAPEICGIPKGIVGLYDYLQADQDGGVAMERWEHP